MLPETPRIPGSLPELLGVTSCVTYMQQYGASAYERSDNKKGTLPIYRQLVRWFWGSLGRDIRVTLPSSAVIIIAYGLISRSLKSWRMRWSTQDFIMQMNKYMIYCK